VASPPIEQAPLYVPAGLVNQHGRPLRSTTPVDPFRAPGDALEAYDTPPAFATRSMQPFTSSTWTIGAIRSAKASHDQGDFSASGQLCDALMSDDRVQATMESRSAALLGAPPLHEPATQGKALVDPWAEAYTACVTYDVAEALVQSAILMRVAIAEIVWDTEVTPWQPYLRPVHPSLIRWDWGARCYVVQTLDGPVVVTPGDGRWFAYTPSGAVGGWLKGAVRALGQPWFIRQQTWRDWARYNERHGLPMLKAMVPAAGDTEMKRRFIDGLANLGQESVVLLPQSMSGNANYDVQMLEAKDRAWETFQRTIESCDMAIVLTIKWQNLTTQVEGGAYAAARVHAGVAQTGVVRDNVSFHDAIRRCVARPWAKFNYGDADKAPYTLRDVEPVEDNKTEAEVFGAFTPAGIIKLAAKYGIELTESDIEKVKPPPAPVIAPAHPAAVPPVGAPPVTP